MRTFTTAATNACFPVAQKFPNEVKVHEKAEMKDMDALAKAGLLTRIEDGAFQLVRYDVTPLGTRAKARFCFGHRDVTLVDSFTPLRVEDKRKASDVTYHYRIVDAPVWAHSGAKEAVSRAGAEDKRKCRGKDDGDVGI